MNIVNLPDEHNALDAWAKARLTLASNLCDTNIATPTLVSFEVAAVGAA